MQTAGPIGGPALLEFGNFPPVIGTIVIVGFSATLLEYSNDTGRSAASVARPMPPVMPALTRKSNVAATLETAVK